MGGPVWAVVLTALLLIGAYEYRAMAARISPGTRPLTLLLLPGFALVAGFDGGAQALLGICALAAGLPFFEIMLRDDLSGSFVDWALAAAGTMLLGIPLFAAIAMRQSTGAVDAGWLRDLAAWSSLGWSAAPRGLAWLLTAILITWLSDSGAYLIGRQFGRRPLIPVVSPKKTVEGLAGGLGCAALTGALAVWLFGLDVNVLWGLLIGLVIGVVGVVGDLAESVLKRQAGVKDSGTLIPGHGGMLDRLDALLFTLTAGWYVATFVDRVIL